MDVSIWPGWPPQPNEFMQLAAALLLAALAGEGVARLGGLPRVIGYSLAGLLLGPAAIGWFGIEDLQRFRIVVDLALALLLFELGVRVDVRWFRANPWLLASSVIESSIAFVAVFVAMLVMGYTPGLSATVAAIAIGTSPAVVMRVAGELRAAGQVTQRLFVLCALNVAYSVVLSKLIVGALHGTFRGDWMAAVIHPLYLIVGSIAVGALLAHAFRAVRGAFDLADEQGVVVLFGLLLSTMAILEMLRLPGVLAPLVAGAVVKYMDPRPLLWPRHFGTAGGVLVIALFMLTGMSLTLPQLLAGGLTALVLVVVRFGAKLAGVFAAGERSGLSRRQALALGVALTPLSGVAFVLADDIRGMFPGFGAQLVPIVFSLVAILELVGAVGVQWGLRHVGETGVGEK